MTKRLALLGIFFAVQLLGQSSPLTLDQVLSEALANNLKLLAERFNLTIGEARLIQARLRPNPVLSLGGNYLDILGAGFNPSTNAAGPTEINARVDFLLERGNKRNERIAVAQAARSVAELELLNTTRNLVIDIQSTFTDLLLARESLALSRESLAAFERIVAVNRTRVDSGDLARVELVRSEVAVLQFQNQVRQANLRLRTTRNRLQALMGRTTYDPAFDITGDMRRAPLTSTKDEVIQSAMATRPDLNALRRDFARSQAEFRLQIAQGKADFTVGAGANRQIGVGGLNSGNSVGLFFAMPLMTANRNQGEIERARQEQAQITARIRALEQEIRSDIENAFEQYESSRALLANIEGTMLSQAQRVREVIDFSYRRGEATFVELLDAQRTFNDTMQALNEARAEFARTLFLIDSLSGKATPTR